MEPSQPLQRLPGSLRLQVLHLLLLMLMPEGGWGKYVKGNLSTKEVSPQLSGGGGQKRGGEGAEPIRGAPSSPGPTRLSPASQAATPAFCIFGGGPPGCARAGGDAWAARPTLGIPSPAALPPHLPLFLWDPSLDQPRKITHTLFSWSFLPFSSFSLSPPPMVFCPASLF